MRGGRLVIGLLLLAVVAAACVPQPPVGQGRNPDVDVNVMVTGLTRPWDVAFTPDDAAMVFDERPGRVWVIKPFPSGTPVLVGDVASLQTSPPLFNNFGEAGVTGLAIDPSFATNHYIYACLSTNSDIRVVRFTTDLTPGSLQIDNAIVTGIPMNVIGRHFGCRIRFRPFANPPQLFVGTGDAASGPGPQDKNSLAGKVLCIDRDGKGCPGNPGIGVDDFDDRIFSWGHRNVQGIAFDPLNGGGYSVEHGPDRDDEVNLVIPGDFGWDPVPGDGSTTYHDAPPMTHEGAIEAVWSSGFPTIAPSGATIVHGSQWRAWDGALVIAVLKGMQLRVLFFDQTDPSALVGQTWALNAADVRLRSVAEGPDGNLYVTTDRQEGADELWQVVPR